jgi:hypothetical protein
MAQMNFKKTLVVLGTIIVVGTILAACSSQTTTPTPTDTPVRVPIPDTPYLAEWQSSAHANVADEPFRHWDDLTENPEGVPTTCAKCHTSVGYQDHLGADGSEAGKVDAAVSAELSQGIQCIACHNAVTISKTSVVFPSGVEIKDLGDDSRCMECHQGRESKVSIDKAIAAFGEDVDPDAVPASFTDDQGKDISLGFKNIHYYAAAATLYGSMAHGGYEYDGLTYDAKNTHVEGYDSCIGCHDPHTLKVKVDECSVCHEGIATVDDLKNIRQVSSAKDYDGDGNLQEGIYYEIEGLQETLLAQIQAYAMDTAGAEIKYSPDTYPYFMGSDDKNYPNWTPRLLRAAYNYQVSLKDPGAFAHGPKYIIELLHDSIADLGGDVSTLARDDAGHFAGNTEPFRHWDKDDEGNPVYEVEATCAKCHSATGLPQFLQFGVTLPAESSNGFMCSTCHNESAWPARYEVASVKFPSGAELSFGGKDADGNFIPDDSNLCIECHQGRSSTPTLNKTLGNKELDTVDASIRFSNIHYFAAGATLFGADAQGAYMYEGKVYASQNMHADPAGKMNKCQDCHDVHALEPKVEACAACHGTSDPGTIRESTVDYDGDGNVSEGIKGEVDTLTEALFAQIQTYAEANGGAITYDTHVYPYFSGADGKSYTTWTPRLLKAAFNYQYVQKDPGAYVHNPKFVMQFLIDSIEDLGGDVSTYTRP